MLCSVRMLTGQLFWPCIYVDTDVDRWVVVTLYRGCIFDLVQIWPVSCWPCFAYWYTDVDGSVVVETHVQMLNVDPDVDSFWPRSPRRRRSRSTSRTRRSRHRRSGSQSRERRWKSRSCSEDGTERERDRERRQKGLPNIKGQTLSGRINTQFKKLSFKESLCGTWCHTLFRLLHTLNSQLKQNYIKKSSWIEMMLMECIGPLTNFDPVL